MLSIFKTWMLHFTKGTGRRNVGQKLVSREERRQSESPCLQAMVPPVPKRRICFIDVSPFVDIIDTGDRFLPIIPKIDGRFNCMEKKMRKRR